MIKGEVTLDGIPQIILSVAGRSWTAVVDSGFNGDLELPSDLQEELDWEYAGPVLSYLAANQAIEEDAYVVQFPFDGDIVVAEATFVTGDEILLGTRLLRNHRLTIDFPAGSVRIERVAGN